MSGLLIYGATGYTGALIARAAGGRALHPVLAGRTAGPLAALAGELALDHRVFGLEAPAAVAAGLRGVRTVLNCAGPFRHTAAPLADACLRAGVNYLDITGEVAVFEALAARDAAARQAGVVLLPGVGFDVVPSDCLAAHLKRRLPSATRLALAFRSAGRMSRGTALTAIDRMSDGGLVRRDGVLLRVPAAWKTRVIDFGGGPRVAMTIPWGDVATAFHTTGIPNVEVYLAAPWPLRAGALLTRWFGPLLDTAFVQRRLRKRIGAGPPGPTEADRRANRCAFWGEVSDEAGGRAVARLETPDGYTLTVETAVAAAARVLAGDVAPGFQTPARAFGPDFVLGIPGVVRMDETA
ncbi:MAG TPA: saccharopine dehydrogenase NADP-binding domain-containing protein [Gemmataceae bacterium]|jgi:short subunit dehydrogenase-like uncharacterized protein|nr:saccharopine dehydrogenase NADP-binding domain-containing protein [Gemmataceae bacterium]